MGHWVPTPPGVITPACKVPHAPRRARPGPHHFLPTWIAEDTQRSDHEPAFMGWQVRSPLQKETRTSRPGHVVKTTRRAPVSQGDHEAGTHSGDGDARGWMRRAQVRFNDRARVARRGRSRNDRARVPPGSVGNPAPCASPVKNLRFLSTFHSYMLDRRCGYRARTVARPIPNLAHLRVGEARDAALGRDAAVQRVVELVVLLDRAPRHAILEGGGARPAARRVRAAEREVPPGWLAH